MTNYNLLSRAECSAMRGIAILGIVLHNFCHWLGPVVKENEYTYSQHNVDWMRQALIGADAMLPMHLLSFFGHYGVPVFLFLSAYGLTLKYGDRPQETSAEAGSALQFIQKHFRKLFLMMIGGFVAFTIFDAITPGSWRYTIYVIVGQLLMINNLFPDPDHMIWPGPYWFFGLMLQLYIVYRLFMYRRHWSYTVALMVACTALQMCFLPESNTLNWLRYNFIGSMLPFGMGLLVARYSTKWRDISRGVHALLLLLSVAVVCVAGICYWTWFLVPPFVCVATIEAVKLLPHSVNKLLEWVGGISAMLFVLHPILRKVFIPISRRGDYYTGLLLYVIACIFVAWAVAEVKTAMKNVKKLQNAITD